MGSRTRGFWYGVAYGCCVGSWEKFARNVVPAAGSAPVLGLAGQTSIGQAYNSILEAYRGRGFDAIILQHDDLQIADHDHVEKILTLFAEDPGLGLIGVAGGMYGAGLAWWNAHPIGRVQAESVVVDFGARSGNVDLLDGCFLAISPAALEWVGFHERPGFHGYDCDYSMRVHDAGMRVVVADIAVHHHTELGFDDAASHEDWLDADREFRSTWDA